MRKSKFICVLLGVVMIFTMFVGCDFGKDKVNGNEGQNTPPDTLIDASDFDDNPLVDDRVKLIQFDYSDVTLTDGLFKDVYDGCMAYYDELTADDVLYFLRELAEIDTKTGRDLGWQTNSNMTACSIEQLISAKARRYAVTKSQKDLQIVKDIAAGIPEIFAARGTYTTWNSPYFVEKQLRAFLDIYNCTGLEEGYTLAKSLVDWALTNDQYAKPVLKLGDNGNDNGTCEWYTMSEALYMFAELARAKKVSGTQLKKYLDFAKLYEYRTFWDIFQKGEDLFDYSPEAGSYPQYFHAYSHANSFNSALEAYKTTGDTYYLDATQKFYAWMNDTEKLATGGYGPRYEWLLPKDGIIDQMSQSHASSETQCNSYAVVNLSDRLMQYTLSGTYGNWLEDVFYNMTIASLETEGGAATYYSNYNPNGATKFLRTDWRWACCAGTRPLVVMEYLKSIYFHDTENLYVNLYTNSEVEFTAKSGAKIGLRQQSEFPESDTVTFTVNVDAPAHFTLRFRKPDWLTSNAVMKINGKDVPYETAGGWLKIARTWKDGDIVTLKLPMGLRFASTVSEEYDNYAIYAVKYGPITLACEGNRKDVNQYVKLEQSADSQLSADAKPLTFTANKNNAIKFKPYYEYGKDEQYILYIRSLMTLE